MFPLTTLAVLSQRVLILNGDKSMNQFENPFNYLNEGTGNPWPGQASERLRRAVRSRTLPLESLAKRGRVLLTGSVQFIQNSITFKLILWNC